MVKNTFHIGTDNVFNVRGHIKWARASESDLANVYNCFFSHTITLNTSYTENRVNMRTAWPVYISKCKKNSLYSSLYTWSISILNRPAWKCRCRRGGVIVYKNCACPSSHFIQDMQTPVPSMPACRYRRASVYGHWDRERTSSGYRWTWACAGFQFGSTPMQRGPKWCPSETVC